jgi:hypothetical protein
VFTEPLPSNIRRAHTQQVDLMSLLLFIYFFESMESKIKWDLNEKEEKKKFTTFL